MARSARLKELQTRVTELRVRSLPAMFDPTGTYTLRQLDRTRGFRLLAHAEIEACIEDLGMDTVNAAFLGWKADKRPRATLIALAVFAEGKGDGAPRKLKASQDQMLPDRLDELRKAYGTRVKGQNNGVREADVLRILLPAGIREHEIDPAWLATINSFGQKRGDTAHRAGRPQTPPDPETELNTVQSIVAGLVPLDARLSQLAHE